MIDTQLPNPNKFDEQDVRWLQSLDTFGQALKKLSEGTALYREEGGFGVGPYGELSKEGLIQRYEYTFEQGRKTLVYYLEFIGQSFVPQVRKSQKMVFQKAVNLGILPNVKQWIEALDARNQASHHYDEPMANNLVVYIVDEGEQLLLQLYTTFYELANS